VAFVLDHVALGYAFLKIFLFLLVITIAPYSCFLYHRWMYDLKLCVRIYLSRTQIQSYIAPTCFGVTSLRLFSGIFLVGTIPLCSSKCMYFAV